MKNSMVYLSLLLALTGLLAAPALACGRVRLTLQKRNTRNVVVRLEVRPSASMKNFVMPLASVITPFLVKTEDSENATVLTSPGIRPLLTESVYRDAWRIRMPPGSMVSVKFPLIRATGPKLFCEATVKAKLDIGAPRTKSVVFSKLRPQLGDDVVLAIDDTGSMGRIINRLGRDAGEVFDTVVNNSIDGNVGVVRYNDPGFERVQELTNDRDAVVEAIQALRANGGGNFREEVYSALLLSFDSAFRKRTLRTILVIADAPQQDPERRSGLVLADIEKAANNLEIEEDPKFPGVTSVPFPGLNPVSVVPIGTNRRTARDLGLIADATFGESFPITERAPGRVVSKVVEALMELVMKP